MRQERLSPRNGGEKMKVFGKTKIGPFLIISSVLAVWTFLAAQPVQAHPASPSLPTPTCSGLPTAQGFFTSGSTIAITATSVTPKIGTGGTSGNANLYYAQITASALTAGELTVSGGAGPSDAILCGRQEGNVTSQTNYVAHNSALNAAAVATRAANDNSISEPNAKRALHAAAAALNAVATALTAAGHAAAAASTAASTATGVAAAAADTHTSDETGALTAAAAALTTAAALFHQGFEINTVISSGDEEYVVVVAIPAGGSAPSLTVGFAGVTGTTTVAGTPTDTDMGSFVRNNQRITHTLTTTADTPGLLTVHTRGTTVRTKGTLEDSSNNTVAMDEGSGGNFKIVSPVAAGTYTLHVEGQARSERGEYDLKLEFGVASALTIGTSPENTMVEPGRAEYFFFPIAADGHSFLIVQTQQPMAVTRETDTTGALFSQDGLVVTDTNSGTGNNFLFRVPVAPGNYIVEVKGASSSTQGAYTLVTSSEAAPSRGSAPDAIMVSATETDSVITNAGEVDPHSITVTKAGTLQVKTTGTTDTVGVLYGPDGRQIATDDNSGADTNFLITEYVEAGQYIVTVEGQSRSITNAAYTLVTNFVEGATVDGPTTPPGTGTETEQELRDQIADLREDLNACLGPVETDARGELENPSDGSFRSGIGIISGWVCAAQEVEVEIRRAPDVLVQTLTVAHGTSRPDVPENSSCTNENAGFGMTYNFNHLPEGTYTIDAYADGDNQIGETQTFEVVHLVPFAATDSNRFLEDLDGQCIAHDFPVRGERTWLKWEQSTQNFVIEDAG